MSGGMRTVFDAWVKSVLGIDPGAADGGAASGGPPASMLHGGGLWPCRVG